MCVCVCMCARERESNKAGALLPKLDVTSKWMADSHLLLPFSHSTHHAAFGFGSTIFPMWHEIYWEIVIISIHCFNVIMQT